MASRGHSGGLSSATSAAAAVFDAAGFDVVLIETVGTGQSEVEVAATADTTVVVEAPEMRRVRSRRIQGRAAGSRGHHRRSTRAIGPVRIGLAGQLHAMLADTPREVRPGGLRPSIRMCSYDRGYGRGRAGTAAAAGSAPELRPRGGSRPKSHTDGLGPKLRSGPCFRTGSTSGRRSFEAAPIAEELLRAVAAHRTGPVCRRGPSPRPHGPD